MTPLLVVIFTRYIPLSKSITFKLILMCSITKKISNHKKQTFNCQYFTLKKHHKKLGVHFYEWHIGTFGY